MMLPFEKCPVCGGELKNKVVEKILHGGNHTAILEIKASGLLAFVYPLWLKHLSSEATIKSFKS